MKKICYSKINSYRSPQFRIMTNIVEEANHIYVEKAALSDAAVSHIQTIFDNYYLIRDLYKDIDVLPLERVDEKTVRFKYINGSSINDVNRLLSFNEEYLIPFSMTKGFCEMFPGCTPKDGEPAVSVANLDGIPTNCVHGTNGTTTVYDYEWVCNFPVPISYLKFRIFGYSEDSKELCQKMEHMFHKYVHGFDSIEGKGYPYNIELVNRYSKDVVDIRNLIEEHSILKTEHDNVLHSKSWKLTKPLRSIKNIVK